MEKTEKFRSNAEKNKRGQLKLFGDIYFFFSREGGSAVCSFSVQQFRLPSNDRVIMRVNSDRLTDCSGKRSMAGLDREGGCFGSGYSERC